MRPEASNAGVETGPQPPPPTASMKPANKPSGASTRLHSGRVAVGVGARLVVNRRRM